MVEYNVEKMIRIKEAESVCNHRSSPPFYKVVDVTSSPAFGYDWAIFQIEKLGGYPDIFRDIPVLRSFTAYDHIGSNKIGGNGCFYSVFDRAAFNAL